MKTDEIKLSISTGLGVHMEQAGFKYKKATFDYVQKKGDSSSIFSILLHSKTGWFLVESAVFIGSVEVNKLYNNALGKNHPTSAWTCGFGIRNRLQNRGNYPIHTHGDVAVATTALISDFEEIALPVFKQYIGTGGVDSFLNKPGADGKYKPVSIPSACFGLIAAKLVKNNNFPQIFEDYYEFCKASQGKELAESIKTVRDFIKDI